MGTMNTELGSGAAPQQDSGSMNSSLTNALVTQDDRAMRTLARSISLSRARFSLVFVRYHRSCSKADTLNLLQTQYGLTPQALEIPVGTTQLYPLIQQLCDKQLPSSLFISGLDRLNKLDELLISTNQMRDEFRRRFSFPLVFWVNDESVRKLIKLAPDFYNWASAPISLNCT